MSARRDEQIWMFERTIEFIRLEMAQCGGDAWPGRTWFYRRRRLLELRARLGQVQRELTRFLKQAMG